MKKRGYIVLWKDNPMYWSERHQRFYSGGGYGSTPITMMRSERLAQQRIATSKASWEDSTDSYYHILVVAEDTTSAARKKMTNRLSGPRRATGNGS